MPHIDGHTLNSVRPAPIKQGGLTYKWITNHDRSRARQVGNDVVLTPQPPHTHSTTYHDALIGSHSKIAGVDQSDTCGIFIREKQRPKTKTSKTQSTNGAPKLKIAGNIYVWQTNETRNDLKQTDDHIDVMNFTGTTVKQSFDRAIMGPVYDDPKSVRAKPGRDMVGIYVQQL